MPSRSPALALLITLAPVVASACSSDDGGTSGKRIVMKTVAEGDPAARTTFTTGFGWSVTLTRAAVATSGVYYFDGPPPTATYRPRRRGLGDFFLGTAHAHPGHYQPGTALGQVLLATPIAIDVLSPAPLALPDADAVTGTYRSARFVFPPAPPADAALAGHLALAEGTAVKSADPAAAPIHFRLVADAADVAASVKNGAVDGCVLEEAAVAEAGTVTMTVRPAIWLNLVDFSKIAPGTADAPTEARDPGFSQGVTQLSAYRFRYSR